MATRLLAQICAVAICLASPVYAAPPGFTGLCDRYGWLCEAGWGPITEGQIEAAHRLNARVNLRYPATSDWERHGVDDLWRLPTKAEGGDCEDIAMALKMELQRDHGIAPSRLLLALTVADGVDHAVLLLTTDDNVLVLDSLRPDVVTLKASGYRIYEVQSARNPAEWRD